MAGQKPDDLKESAAVVWARYSQVAFIIPAAVVVGYFLGKLFDYWLHTRWLFIVGVILGSIIGFVDLIRMVTRQKS